MLYAGYKKKSMEDSEGNGRRAEGRRGEADDI